MTNKRKYLDLEMNWLSLMEIHNLLADISNIMVRRNAIITIIIDGELSLNYCKVKLKIKQRI